MKIKLFDKAIGLICILFITEWYKVFLFLGVSVFFTRIIFLLILLVWSYSKLKSFEYFTRIPVVFFWLSLYLLFPFVINTIHLFTRNINFSEYFNAIGINLQLTLLLFGAFYLSMTYGIILVRKIILISFSLIIVGYVLNFLIPGVFGNLSMIIGDVSDYSNFRLTGFYLNSNRAGFLTICTLPLLSVIYSKSSNWSLIHTVHIIVVGIFILFTGSRSSMIFLLLYVILVSYFTKGLFSNALYWLGLPAFILLISTGLFFSNFSNVFYDLGFEKVGDRIEFFQNVNKLDEDKSIDARLTAQKQYLNKIKEQPLLGYGTAKSNYFKEKKIFDRSSHNAFIENVFRFGIIYILILLLTIYKTFLHFWKSIEYNILWIYSILLIMFSFSINGVFNLAGVAVYIGLSIGLVFNNKSGLSPNRKSISINPPLITVKD